MSNTLMDPSLRSSATAGLANRRASTWRSVELLGPGATGVHGFRMTVWGADGAGKLRLWLRRYDPWDRAIDPRALSQQWDVKVHLHGDCAMALVQEFQPSDLDAFGEQFVFPEQPPELGKLRLNGDPLHDLVVRWAWSVTGWGDGPAPKEGHMEEPTASPAPVTADERMEAASGTQPGGESTETSAGVVAGSVEVTGGSLEEAWDDAEEAVARYTGSVEAVASEEDA